MYLTYIVHAGMVRTAFVSSPVCVGPPVSADECFQGKWQSFTVPRILRNEGDCVSFVRSPRR
jgi:hypothetical protein